MAAVTAAALGSAQSVTTTPTTTNTTAIENKITNVQKQIEALNNDFTLSEEEKQEKKEELTKKLNELNKQLQELQQKAEKQTAVQIKDGMEKKAELEKISYGQNNIKPQNIDKTLDFFFGMDNSVDNIMNMDSVRTAITNEARTLKTQIETDRARGVDTKAKEETLGNLNSNLSILNKNLAEKIAGASENSDLSDDDKTGLEKIADKLKTENKEEKEEDKDEEDAQNDNLQAIE